MPTVAPPPTQVISWLAWRWPLAAYSKPLAASRRAPLCPASTRPLASRSATCRGSCISNALPRVRARSSTQFCPSASATSAPLAVSSCTAAGRGWLFWMRPVRPSQSSWLGTRLKPAKGS
ncbi:hypothetical protein D9M71_517850 [compost metagenome]